MQQHNWIFILEMCKNQKPELGVEVAQVYYFGDCVYL